MVEGEYDSSAYSSVYVRRNPDNWFLMRTKREKIMKLS